jgi:hypothetical protein
MHRQRHLHTHGRTFPINRYRFLPHERMRRSRSGVFRCITAASAGGLDSALRTPATKWARPCAQLGPGALPSGVTPSPPHLRRDWLVSRIHRLCARLTVVAELPPKLARGPAGRGEFGPRTSGGALSTHSTLGTWVRESRFVPVQYHFPRALEYPKLFWSSI